jgi:hypothetical protein
MVAGNLDIHDLASLNRWKQKLWTTVWPLKLPTVQFSLRELSGEQNRSISALAESLRNACGCASSGLFMSVTVVSAIPSYFFSGNRLSSVSLIDVLMLIGMTVLGALCGKLGGVIWARFRLMRLAASVRETLVRGTRPVVSQQI